MCAFMMENTLFAGFFKGTVSLIPSRRWRRLNHLFDPT